MGLNSLQPLLNHFQLKIYCSLLNAYSKARLHYIANFVLQIGHKSSRSD